MGKVRWTNEAELWLRDIHDYIAAAGARIGTHLDQHTTPIGDFDILIAAQAIACGLILASNNLREFDRVPGLKTANWV